VTGEPRPDAVCDGGDMDCGSGLLLVIREAMSPLPPGGVLEIRSREVSVCEDLPAWCRMVGHTLLHQGAAEGRGWRFLVRKEGQDEKLRGDIEAARRFAWTARVKWTGGMQARAYARNHQFDVGQPASFETADTAPSAVEHLLAGLGGCLAVGMAWRASRRGIEVRNLEVSLKASAADIGVFLGLVAEGNPGLERVEGSVYVDADADEAVLRELWEETVRRSPVAQSLARTVPLGIELRSV
jgi:TusA-related sulfurtransferase/uncharacterized OsmC-like protein